MGSVQGYATASPVNDFVIDSQSNSQTVEIWGGTTAEDGRRRNSVGAELRSTSTDTHSHAMTGGDSESRPINAGIVFIIKY